MQVVFASGKGGTGKTFLSSNFLHYLRGDGIGVDADVEAPDMILALGGESERDFELEIWESYKARILEEKCIGQKCLKCMEVCKFYAIEAEEGIPRVLRENCEGCGACQIVCPMGAIEIEKTLTGKIFGSYSSYGEYVVTGDLSLGGRNSGHLVETLKEIAEEKARELEADHVIVDAAAGIGCPVVSSIVGAEILVVVLEPTPQSLQGAKRILEMATGMRIRKKFAVLNKTREGFEPDLGIEVIGRVPYDPKVFLAYSTMRPIIEAYPNSKASEELFEIFEILEGELS